MQSRNGTRLAVLAFAMTTANAALAHTGGAIDSFQGGLMHPLNGMDHFLAMLSVGIVSVLLGGWAVLWVPAGFVVSMVFGATVGVLGMNMPFVELGIAASVILLGAGIARGKQFPLVITLAVVALFGCIHGNAHGVEMPRSSVPVFYSFGFVVSTVVIHMIGVGLGFTPIFRPDRRKLVGLIGSGIAAAGVFFLVGAVM